MANSKHPDEAMMAAHGDFAFKLYGPTSFRLMGDEGRILLEIKTDGTVVGEMEDAGDAAKAFVEALRHQLEPMLRPAVSSLGDEEMVERVARAIEAETGYSGDIARLQARAAIAAMTG